MVKLIRVREVTTRTGLPKSSIYQQIAIGAFPKPVPLTARTVAWLEEEINEWIAARIHASRNAA